MLTESTLPSTATVTGVIRERRKVIKPIQLRLQSRHAATRAAIAVAISRFIDRLPVHIEQALSFASEHADMSSFRQSSLKVNDLFCLLPACFPGAAGVALEDEKSDKHNCIAFQAGDGGIHKFECQQNGAQVHQSM